MQIHNIELTLKDYTALNTKLKFKQRDCGAHELKFSGIETENGSYALVKMRRADGKTVVSDRLYTDSGGSISYILDTAVGCKGTVAAEISVYSENDTRITTNTFFFEVVPDINTDDVIESEDKPVIERLLNDSHTHNNKHDLDNIEKLLQVKVDKVSGKGLSTNDFTSALKEKLTGLPTSKELLKYMKYEHRSYYDPGYDVYTLDDLPLPYNAGTGVWIDCVYYMPTESYGIMINNYTEYYGIFWQMLILDGSIWIRYGNSGSGMTGGYLAEDTGWTEYKTTVTNTLTSTSTTSALSANQGRILSETKVDKESGKGLSSNDFTDEYKAMTENTRWELVESVTLTEGVASIQTGINGNYKELYLTMHVPTMNPNNENTAFGKARQWLYVQDNTLIYNDGNVMYTDNGNTWVLTNHIFMTGTKCNVFRIFSKAAEYVDVSAYAVFANNIGDTIAYMYGKDLGVNYISSLKINLSSSTDNRIFPAGTTYELWGIKA